jgi:hypothetical protein
MVTSSAISGRLPLSWKAGTFRKQMFKRSLTTSDFFCAVSGDAGVAGVEDAAGATGLAADGSDAAGSTPGTRVSFGFSPEPGGVILNGILAGAPGLAAGDGGGGVGTGGPLEAGTLSEAEPPAPFGGSLNGILLGLGGAAGPLTGVGAGTGADLAGPVGTDGGGLMEIGRRPETLGWCFSCATGSGSALAMDLADAGSTFTGGAALV